MALVLNQDVFCVCSVDILEYSVEEIRNSQHGTFYVLRSKKPVGRNSFIEILIVEGDCGILRYVELVDTDMGDCEYGLASFTEGSYHTSLESAKSAFAQAQINLIERRQYRLHQDLKELAERKARWATMLLPNN